jgi:hypothetical protein
MAIKKIKKRFTSLLLISGIICAGVLINYPRGERFEEKIETVLSTSADCDENVLIDKVVIFYAPFYTIQYEDLALMAEYNYMTLIEIVTPHNCIINLTIIDPENGHYEVFKTYTNISQDDGWFEIPFGTALSGNYSFSFSVSSELNLNVHIKIEKNIKCFYDILSFSEINRLELYHVTKFYDGKKVTYNLNLKTDYSYRFTISRMSAIGGEVPLDYEVTTYYNIIDPNGVFYQIYANKTLKNIGQVLTFDFGTSTIGVHSVEIEIHCKVEYVNIGYVVFEDYKIGEVDNETKCDPDLPPINPNATRPELPVISSQFTTGLSIFGVVVVGVFAFVGARRKRKGSLKQETL